MHPTGLMRIETIKPSIYNICLRSISVDQNRAMPGVYHAHCPKDLSKEPHYSELS